MTTWGEHIAANERLFERSFEVIHGRPARDDIERFSFRLNQTRVCVFGAMLIEGEFASMAASAMLEFEAARELWKVVGPSWPTQLGPVRFGNEWGESAAEAALNFLRRFWAIVAPTPTDSEPTHDQFCSSFAGYGFPTDESALNALSREIQLRVDKEIDFITRIDQNHCEGDCPPLINTLKSELKSASQAEDCDDRPLLDQDTRLLEVMFTMNLSEDNIASRDSILGQAGWESEGKRAFDRLKRYGYVRPKKGVGYYLTKAGIEKAKELAART